MAMVMAGPAMESVPLKHGRQRNLREGVMQ